LDLSPCRLRAPRFGGPEPRRSLRSERRRGGDHARYRRACRLPALHRDLFQLRGPAFRQASPRPSASQWQGIVVSPGEFPVAAPGLALRRPRRRDRTLLHHQPPHDSALDRARCTHHTAGFQDGDKCVLLSKIAIFCHSGARVTASEPGIPGCKPRPSRGSGFRARGLRPRPEMTSYQCSNPTIAPISSVVSVPDRIDFMPSERTSARRSGAITERPPIMMPRLPKLAKPHIA
jgi:hypothetical protein